MRTITTLLGCALMLLSGASMAENLVGSIVPPYPEGFRDGGGACISKALGDKNICQYSLGILRRRGEHLLYLGKSAPRIDPKKARWTVTDQLSIKDVPRGHDISFGLCEQNGVQDETILAIVKITDTDWFTNVHSAYKVNLTTERFEKIPTKGIRCLNEGWGA
ncbi:MAG TPA: hypothetical protein VFF81_09700 [Noviherbaspirillum sp.]|nr:hypothetical protein [Noviherbaspirillum sp.]